MPMIPSGKVDGYEPPRVALAVEKFNWDTLPPPAPELEQAGYCLNPDGSIDNKAQTNLWAQITAELLEVEMDTADPVFCAGIVILAGNPLRFRFGQISDFTGLPRHFCKKVVQNLGYSRLIRSRELAGDLAAEVHKPEDQQDGHTSQILFVLYALAGAGRAKADKDGLWRAVHEDEKFLYEIQKVA